MSPELSAAIVGALAAGCVTFGFEVFKAWWHRRRIDVSASLCLAGGGGRIAHFSFDISLINSGGQTVHIVKYGILGTCRPNAEQQRHITEIKAMEHHLLGAWKYYSRFLRLGSGKKRNEDMAFGRVDFNEILVLVPGEPHFRKEQEIPDDCATQLNRLAYAFAEDSLGRRYTSRFHVPDYEDLKKMRTPEEQAQMEERARRHGPAADCAGNGSA